MKIVLLQNLENLGIIGDIKEVKDGYGRNYLIPKGIAVKFGDPRAKEVIKKAQQEKERMEAELTKQKDFLQKLAGKTITLKAKVGPTGKLFGAITADDIIKKINTKEMIFSPKQIETEPIKDIGEKEIVVHIGKDIKSVVRLKIEAEITKLKKK